MGFGVPFALIGHDLFATSPGVFHATGGVIASVSFVDQRSILSIIDGAD